MLEANYDDILLRESIYPWSVKARIASSHGHLSNRAAAELVAIGEAARQKAHALTGEVLGRLAKPLIS